MHRHRPPRRTVAFAVATALAILAPLTSVSASNVAASSATPLYFNEKSGPDYNVDATYTPIVGDFAGTSATDDILWYAPGAGAEQAWTSTGSAEFTKQTLPQPVSGTFTPLVGDFGGDQRDDIFWYGPGAAADRLWIQTGDFHFTSYVVTVAGTYQPVVLENGTARSDIVWWGPNAFAVPVWSFAGANGTHTSTTLTPAVGTRPVVGHFSPDKLDDIFWYGAGAVKDTLATHAGVGAFTTTSQTINGTYTPLVGDFGAQGDGIEDVLWLTSAGPSTLWVSKGNGTWTIKPQNVPHDGFPVVLAEGGGWAYVYLYKAGTVGSAFNDALPVPELRPVLGTHIIGAGYRPLVGRFSSDHYQNLFWYKPGSAPEYVWR